jgi:uncharacterized phiE125 gp8 family phage protein
MGLSITSPNAGSVIDDATAQAHCKVDTADDLALVQLYRSAAEDALQKYLRRSLLSQTYVLTLDDFPCKRDPYGFDYRKGEIAIPVLPFGAISSIRYYDTAGVDTLLDPSLYVVDSSVKPARVTPAPLEYWPYVQEERPSGCRVTFTAGYASASAVPAAIKSGLLLLIGSLYTNREETVTGTIVARLDELMGVLLSPYKLRWTT